MIVRLFDWDQPRNVKNFLDGIKDNDLIVVDHEWGVFLAEVLVSDKNIEGEPLVGTVIRKATVQDRRQLLGAEKIKKKLVKKIKSEVRKADLPMKISALDISVDGNCLVVSFTADGRVDFRELVRGLSEKLGKTIRFQQIGSRDEARRIGGYGICGREICCKKFRGNLKGITTDMARSQLIYHRGSERISGICGRLMCCLQFEADQYQEVLKIMPSKGEKIEAKGKKGSVVGLNVLEKKVKIELEDGSVMEVDLADIVKRAEKEA